MTDTRRLTLLYNTDAKEIQELFEVMPTTIKPTVSLSDAENGYITRHFLQLVTDKDYIIEVDKIQFENLKINPRFNSLKLKWKIVGRPESERKASNVIVQGIADINREEILKADLTMPGIKRYITDYTEFWFGEES